MYSVFKPLTYITLFASAVAFTVNGPGFGQAPLQDSDPSAQSRIFDEELPLESTDHLVFSSVSSLLQHWPNSRYRNGHTVVPATMPTGTLLYHGTNENQIPDVPEWVSLNPEHSFNFCLSVSNDSGCWQLTLMATRPLKVLYFDGSSAAKMEGGTMDSQDLVIWGEVRPDKTTEEYERIGRLCEWGKRFNLDGFVRMTVNFEMMLCDFSAGVKPVTFLNLVPADVPSLSPRRQFPLRLTSVFRSLEAGTWTNHFPGETRLHLDYSRLISFYDTSLFPNLQSSRFGQSRLTHRLDTISQNDTLNFMAHLNESLIIKPGDARSGVDWQTLLRVITYRFAERLELLHYILDSTSTASDLDEVIASLKQAYRHASSMIAPYILYSAIPPKDPKPTDGKYPWAVPVFELCRTTHSREIEADTLIASKLTSSERLILNATKGVSTEICRVLVEIWAEGRENKMDEPDYTVPLLPTEADWYDMRTRWGRKVERLMKWLDWSYWMRCRPACSYEEMCYMPTWPFFINEKEKIDPQPKCIRRVESFLFEPEDGFKIQRDLALELDN